ncbi:hypothetical protein ACW9YK_27855 (plasmid) [Paraburkholderia graminis]
MPKLLIEKYDKKTHRTRQIFEAAAYYVLTYENGPINHRDVNKLLNNGTPKYLRIAYSNKGTAVQTARRLNKLFQTDKFSAAKVVSYEPVVDAPKDAPRAPKKSKT